VRRTWVALQVPQLPTHAVHYIVAVGPNEGGQGGVAAVGRRQELSEWGDGGFVGSMARMG
jgi:hypothetical protein